MGIWFVISVLLLVIGAIGWICSEIFDWRMDGFGVSFWFGTVFLAIWSVSFMCGWTFGNSQVCTWIAYYDTNKNIQETVLKQFNKLAVVNNKYGDKIIVNVDNLQQSTKTSDMITAYQNDITNYNTALTYGRTIRENKSNWWIYGLC